MTRLFLMILLVLSSGPAYAEWIKAATDNEKAMTIYVDPDTVRRKGDLVKIWELLDYKTVQKTYMGESYLSVKVQHEYDCAEERHRPLAFLDYSGNMGHGSVVYSDSDEDKWTPVAPGSVGLTLWKFACGKK
jgi:hypothetical protein